MTTASLTELLDALRNGVDPRTGEVFNHEKSCLQQPAIQKALHGFLRVLEQEPDSTREVSIPDALIHKACEELRSLGYQPTVIQLARVFIGSRSIVDPNLKAIVGYGRYRGVYTRSVIQHHLTNFSQREPTTLPVKSAKPVSDRSAERLREKPWLEIDFFRTEGFNKLDADKETELCQAVKDLGLRKSGDRLPQYMAMARETYPRSFEPWVREEQALLIETMCYTNDPEKIAVVFGRSARSVEAMGQRLIWDSREKRA